MPLAQGALLASLPGSLPLHSRLLTVLSCLCLALLSCLSMSYLWPNCIKAQASFADPTANPVDPLLQLLGAMAFCIEGLCFLSSLTAVVHVSGAGEAPGLVEKGVPSSWRHAFARPSHKRSTLQCCSCASLTTGRLLLLVALPVALSMVLPPAWATACETWQVYAGNAPVAAYTLLSPTATLALNALPGFGFTPSTPPVNLNLYVDVAVYYAVLVAVMALGCAGLALPACRRALHRRLFVLPLPLSVFSPASGGASWYSPTLGEACLLSAWAGLVGYWAYFWAFAYTRIATNASADAAHPGAHTAARALGHMCTLFLSLALLPLAKGSIWETVFGVPYERALSFHRLNGLLFWGAVTAHGATWMAKWSAQGLLAHNLAATGSPRQLCLYTDSTGACSSHGNNFTIPIMAAAWLVTTLAVLVALARRHLPWELFQASHTALLWVVLAAEVHAWSHWYHSLGGLALYAFDKAARAGQSAAAHPALTCLPVSGSVTLLEVQLPGSAPAPAPGAHMMLCIPALAPLEWHPITVADFVQQKRGGRGKGKAAAAQLAVFNIKSMGPGSWSDRLLALAREGSASSQLPLQVHLCGPYGSIPLPPRTAHVLAVAGGIGITPVLALCRAMLQGFEPVAEEEGEEEGSSSSSSSSSLLGWGGVNSGLVALSKHAPDVTLTLVWAVQEAEVLGLACETLGLLLDCGVLAEEDLHLHVTAKSGSSSGRGGLLVDAWPAVRHGLCTYQAAERVARLVRWGRPELQGVAAGVRVGGRGEGVQVVACGPAGLTREAAGVARARGWDIHTEVFHY